jgi:hypothetical protein
MWGCETVPEPPRGEGVDPEGSPLPAAGALNLETDLFKLAAFEVTARVPQKLGLSIPEAGRYDNKYCWIVVCLGILALELEVSEG